MAKIVLNGQELVLSSRNGKSAYEIAVENGFEGTEQEWLESLVGPEGPTGQNVGDVYSTEETRIGTWMGKPLYRKAFQTIIQNDINVSTSSELLHVSVPIEHVRVIEASVKTQSGQWCSVPYYVSADDTCWVGYNGPNHINAPNSIRISGSINQVDRTIIITIEYTKTTDEPGSGLVTSQVTNLVFGHGLTTSKQDSKTLVEVDTVDDFTGDKTLPMSAVGVETQIGNIESLLETI